MGLWCGVRLGLAGSIISDLSVSVSSGLLRQGCPQTTIARQIKRPYQNHPRGGL